MKKPILVTGSHRSGSTWIGQIISSAPAVHYIHEPFNINISRNRSPFDYWYQYLCKNTEDQQQQEAFNYLNTFDSVSLHKMLQELLRIRSIQECVFYLNDFFKGSLAERTLIKDPLALMSAEWIADKLNSDVIISIRHPAAFVASLKVKGWKFDFNHLLEQKDLMNDHLKRYEDQIRAYSASPPALINQGVLLWNVIYSTVKAFQDKHKDQWIFVKHEDLSLRPVPSFKNLFNSLDLEFTLKIENKIVESTSSGKASDFKRDSKSNIKSWKKRLTSKEIELIKKETKDVWENFYEQSDWS